ncbi:MAG TPA: hypothetical protein VMT88_02440 [Actinomycetes bacterium]|nr:hypothetical protein [Actinomycetes bacterium]
MTTEVGTWSASSEREVVSHLIRMFPRLLRWLPAVGACILVGAITAWKYDSVETSAAALWLLRFAGLSMIVGTVFLLDDASANITNSTPTILRLRAGLRLMLMGSFIAVVCVLVFVVVEQKVPLGAVAGGVGIEIAAAAVVTAAFSLMMQRSHGLSEPGQFAGVVSIGVFLAAQLIGVLWPMLVPPGDLWTEAHWRWAGLALIGVILLAWQLRDPASGSWVVRRSR